VGRTDAIGPKPKDRQRFAVVDPSSGEDSAAGSIALPRQSFLAQNQLYDCEHMVFNPWNSLPEHRPLGSVDRMRFAVYLASRQVRRKTEHGGS
jgi:hypothetical protein